MKLFNDYKDKIQYPVNASIKLDGIFCIVKNNKGYSKEGKEFKAIGFLDYPDNTEGELYNHQLTFEEIVSAVKRDVPNELTKHIKFYEHARITKYYDIPNYEKLLEILDNIVNMHYEGLVIEPNMGILKLKPIYDEEYKIIDILEGKGKLKGKAGKIVFENFSSGILGSYSYLEELWLNKDKYIGQLATVQYQNKTSNNIPRFPKVKSIRNYE